MQSYGYLGIPGSYAEEALLTHFQGAIEPVPLSSLRTLVHAVEAGGIDGGILPVDDGSSGPVHDVLDLLETTELVLAEKFWVTPHHCLLALPGQTIHDLRQVLSQQEILSACEEWLSELGVELLSMADAATCAKHVWEQQLAGVAVVASARAAAVYHLDVLKQMRPRSPTRYVLLRCGSVRRALVISRPKVGGKLVPAGHAPVEGFSWDSAQLHPILLSSPGRLASSDNGGLPAQVSGLDVLAPPIEALLSQPGSYGKLKNATPPLPEEAARPSAAPSGTLSTGVSRSPWLSILRRGGLRELVSGARAALPMVISLVPLLIVFGVLARAADLSLLETMALAIFVFSGFQLVAVQMILGGAPGILIFAAGATMNTRHLIYSAQLAPYLRRLPLAWRLLLAYLLTDEVWALSLHRYRQVRQLEYQHWFGLGAGLMIWVVAQGATLAGVLLGGQVPTSWHLELAAPFTFLSLLVLSQPSRAGMCAALAAGLTALLAVTLPLNLGLLVATGLGMVVGLIAERLPVRRRAVR